MPDNLRLAHRRLAGRQKGVDHRVDDGIELLLRRIPRFQQVVIDVHQVDGRNGRLCVRVRRQQRPSRPRVQVHRRLQELDAVHFRHPVVGEQDRDLFATQFELTQRIEGLGT